jgi:mono/diheme cytochrome c family protein
MDVMVVLESIARGTYQTSPAFKQVTQEPYPSAAAPGSNVSEWVSTASWYQYIAISPGVTGSLVTLPAGTTIVRAVLNEDGGVAKLTLMHKGPAGFNPALGDWWFAVTDPDGLPLESDGGAEEGKLTGCYSCHIPRSEDGFVFGVPLDDRVAGGTPSAP